MDSSTQEAIQKNYGDVTVTTHLFHDILHMTYDNSKIRTLPHTNTLDNSNPNQTEILK